MKPPFSFQTGLFRSVKRERGGAIDIALREGTLDSVRATWACESLVTASETHHGLHAKEPSLAPTWSSHGKFRECVSPPPDLYCRWPSLCAVSLSAHKWMAQVQSYYS